MMLTHSPTCVWSDFRFSSRSETSTNARALESRGYWCCRVRIAVLVEYDVILGQAGQQPTPAKWRWRKGWWRLRR